MSSYLRWMWSVARKELLDIGRDRRTLFMALLLGPLMYPLMMFGMQAMAESRMKTELDRELEVPVIGAEHAPNLIAHLGTLGIRAIDPPADLDAIVKRHGLCLPGQLADLRAQLFRGYHQILFTHAAVSFFVFAPARFIRRMCSSHLSTNSCTSFVGARFRRP